MHAEQTLPRTRRLARPKARAGTLTEWRLFAVALIAVDALALVLAFAIAYVIRFKTGLPLLETPPHSLDFYSSLAFAVVPAWLGIFALNHLYDREYLFAGFQEYVRVVNGCTVGMVVVILASYLGKDLFISRGWLLIVWLLSILLVGSSRFVLRRLLRRLRTQGALVVRTVIVGANEEGQAIAEQFLEDPGSGTQILGFVDPLLRAGTLVSRGLPVLGDLADLEEILQREAVKEIVVATTTLSRADLLELYQTFGHLQDVEIRLSSGLFEILTTGVRVQEVSNVPLLTPQRVRIVGVDAALKTALDYAGAILGLLVLSPAMLLIALLVKLDSPGPVLHRRLVLGRSGKPFHALKFRTMVVDSDRVLAENPELRAAFERGFKLKDDPRVTPVGRFLRRTSLDELPQLINVLRGEMSLVGPRMISPEEVARYGKWQLNLLTVKPGLTGPWQVRGRGDIPYDERVRLSMQYIRNYNLWLDLEILLRTIPAVLQARGAY